MRNRKPKGRSIGQTGFISMFVPRASVFLFLGTSLLWIFAICFYIRSKFRADVVTVIVPGQRCVVLESDLDGIGIGCEHPWPGPRLIAWSSGIAVNAANYVQEINDLNGPQFIRNRTSQGPSRQWGFFIGTKFPLYFAYTHIPHLSVWYDKRQGATVGNVWRQFLITDEGDTEIDVNVYYLSSPVWILPWVTAIIPLLWLLIAGRRRWRVWLRERKGLCRRCGYDLRETHAKCPECGEMRLEDRKKHSDWKIAVVGILAILFAVAVYLRWEY